MVQNIIDIFRLRYKNDHDPSFVSFNNDLHYRNLVHTPPPPHFSLFYRLSGTYPIDLKSILHIQKFSPDGLDTGIQDGRLRGMHQFSQEYSPMGESLFL